GHQAVTAGLLHLHLIPHFSPRLKTMEEVWKDINLSSLQDHTTNYSKDHRHHLHDHNHQGANFGGMILQDFLARPFANESSATAAAAASPVSATTMLNLNSGPELHFFDNPLRQNSILHQPNVSGRKRVVSETEDNSTGDRRNQRMIKNRESAARSRARKQESDNSLILNHLFSYKYILLSCRFLAINYVSL
ncbi:hypothetical protein AABB24_024712, partial [Solanum stoloniferum]